MAHIQRHYNQKACYLPIQQKCSFHKCLFAKALQKPRKMVTFSMTGATSWPRLEPFSTDLTNKLYTNVDPVPTPCGGPNSNYPTLLSSEHAKQVSGDFSSQIISNPRPFASPTLVDRRCMLHKMVRKELDVAFSLAILS